MNSGSVGSSETSITDIRDLQSELGTFELSIGLQISYMYAIMLTYT